MHKKAVAAIMWGTLPTGEWLSQHSWKVPPLCPKCDCRDGILHTIVGCPVDQAASVVGARSDWQKALCCGEVTEPVREDDSERKLQGFINGFAVHPSEIHFEEDGELFTDGSCKYVSMRFAGASGAVVQFTADGTELALAGCVPSHLPQSAVCGEGWAVDLLSLGIRNGKADGSPHRPGSLTVWADCEAMIKGFVNSRALRLTSFPYEGFFRNSALDAVSAFKKVDAHVAEFEAQRAGWHAQWRGNDRADERAKHKRPQAVGDPEGWAKERRAATKLLQDLLDSIGLEDLWAPMKRERPAAGSRVRAAREHDPAAHRPVFLGSGWVCRDCGVAFRSFRGAAASSCPGRVPAASLAHRSHNLHTARFGDACGADACLVLCSACGAHGTSQVLKLAAPCPAAGGGGGSRARYRKQAAAVRNGFHPSRPGFKLFCMNPLPRQEPVRPHAATLAEQPACKRARSDIVAEELFFRGGPGNAEDPALLAFSGADADPFDFEPAPLTEEFGFEM